MATQIKFLTTALQCIRTLIPYTLAGFEPGSSFSVGGRDDHYSTPPWQFWQFFNTEGAEMFGLLCSREKRYVLLILTKTSWATLWANFFTNPSGHHALSVWKKKLEPI
jgi:hypothetical protein